MPLSSWLRVRWLEPVAATVSFALSVNLFRIIEADGDVGRSTRSIFDLRKSTRLLRAGAAYWCGIFVLSKILPRAPVEWSCDPLKILADLVFGVVAYDFLFYWAHRSMHRLPTIGRAFSHNTHHSGKGLKAHHVLEHSLADGTLQVLTNIFVQRYGPFGPRNWLARLLHNVIVTYLLTESHADLQGPPSTQEEFDENQKDRRLRSSSSRGGPQQHTMRWRGISGRFPTIFKGAHRHRLHHNHSGPPYEQFFGYLDDIFSPVPATPFLRNKQPH